MRILIHGINFTPELTGIGKYTGEMAAWLANRGHEVRAVSAPPYYPAWQTGAGYSNRRYRSEVLDGVKVWRTPLYVPSVPSGLKRIIHLASFAVGSLPVVLRQALWRPDVIIAVEPAFFCAPTALLAGALSGAKTLLHIQDFEVDAAFDLGIIRSGFLRQIVTLCERLITQRFDRVSTISSRMMEKLVGKGVTSERIIFFPNWVDARHIYPFDHESPLRRELRLDANRVVALYSGNWGEKQGLDIVIEAASKLQKRSDILFVLCGDGATYQRMRQQAADLSNILWLPLQPFDRLNDLLNLADIHLLPQRADVADLVMPSKLTGMLASGRPVLATALNGTQVADVLLNAGVVVPPGDVDQFVEALLALAGDPQRRKSLGAEARRFALQNLDRDAVLSTFEHDLESLIAKS